MALNEREFDTPAIQCECRCAKMRSHLMTKSVEGVNGICSDVTLLVYNFKCNIMAKLVQGVSQLLKQSGNF